VEVFREENHYPRCRPPLPHPVRHLHCKGFALPSHQTAMPCDVEQAVKDLTNDFTTYEEWFIAAEQLHKDGQPVSSLPTPLKIKQARKMYRAEWNPIAEWGVLGVTTRKYKPMKLYDWFLDLINESSFDEATKLRHIRTLGAMFEVRSDDELLNWQGFRVTAYTIFGRVCQDAVLNNANGHMVTRVSMPDLQSKSHGQIEKMRAMLRQIHGK